MNVTLSLGETSENFLYWVLIKHVVGLCSHDKIKEEMTDNTLGMIQILSKVRA